MLEDRVNVSTHVTGFTSEDDALLQIVRSISNFCIRQTHLNLTILMVKQSPQNTQPEEHLLDILNCYAALKEKQDEGRDINKIIVSNSNWNIAIEGTSTLVSNRENRYYIAWPFKDFQIIIGEHGTMFYHGNRQSLLSIFPVE